LIDSTSTIDTNNNSNPELVTFASVDADSYKRLYEAQREENSRIQRQLDLTRSERTNSPASVKPRITCERVRATVGELAFLNMTRKERLVAVDVDPSVTDEFLKKVFGRGSNGSIGRDLHRTDPANYARLREAAKITNAFGG
jgi:hypothetical protein